MRSEEDFELKESEGSNKVFGAMEGVHGRE